MGKPIQGAWARKYQNALTYAGAEVWGTGISAVHAQRGDTSRPENPKLDANQLDRTMAGAAIPEQQYDPSYGYNPEDIAGLDTFASPQEAVNGEPYAQDGWPSWDEDTEGTRARIAPQQSRPLGQQYASLRSIRGGAVQGPFGRVSNETPSETVSEGWLNKAEDGEVPDDHVLPADDSQLIIATSFVQRHKTLNNDRAVMRGQDDARTEIPSRLAPMKTKHYSQGERDYDMFPYQQDNMPRPFKYRTAGTGPGTYLLANDQYPRDALQRTPPADASMGTPDTELSDPGYGYSSEDTGYY